MAHFAEIDDTNKVVRVLLVPDEFEEDGANYLANVVGLGGKWIQTSYNSNVRNKFAGIGDLYDPKKDIFIQAEMKPKPKPNIEEPTDV